jgi:hypothetical protein
VKCVQQVVREKYRNKSFFAVMIYTYIYPNQTVIRCASYINEKDTCKWVQGFCPREGIKKKANARVLEDVTSFLSNSTGSSNSSQQWGLKSPEETLVKIEITGYNEG